MTEKTERYDAVVIGGGAAGLSGALALARARRTVLVIDDGRPRNARAAHVHAYLTRDGAAPSDLLAAGRAEVAGYGAAMADARVVSAARLAAGDFRVVMDDGTAVFARRLLLATGLVDELPPLPGLAERFGRDVLHCPYCHGWEARDSAIGILGTGPFATQQALLWRQWSDDVTLFLHTAPEPGDTAREELAARGIEVVEGEVRGLEAPDDELAGVRLADGGLVPCRALVVTPRFRARVEFFAGLGLTTAEQAMEGHVFGTRVEADPSGATEVPGVWVAGNVTSLVEQVIGAAGAGVRAGAAINADLIAEDTREAVAARRHLAAHGEDVSGQDFWDARYAQNEHIWSGAPNPALVEEVEDLPRGRALDLGCGEGGDAVWLAGRGWRVTAVDISPIALSRAEGHAADAGVSDLVDWQLHDLVTSFPEGEYDLVSAQYLHLRGATMPREDILRAAASAVAPGGVLLVAGHSALPQPQDQSGHAELDLPTPEEVLSSLRLPEGKWEVLRSEEQERVHTGHDGTSASRTDNIVLVRRYGA